MQMLLIQFATGQDAIGFPVLGARGLDNLGRKFRAWRSFCPLHSFEIVADKLFVKRCLGTAGTIMASGPKTRRIGREGLVDPDQFVVEQAEFELCVGKNDPARFGISRSAPVDFQAYGADSSGKILADKRRGLFKGDVFVVAGGGFRGRGKDGFRQAVGFAQS